MVKRLVRKQGEKEADSGEKALDQSKAQSGVAENMLWEAKTFHEEASNFKFFRAPSPGTNNGEGSPLSSSVELGPLAKSYDMSNERIAIQVGPTTSDNAKEVSDVSLSGPNRNLNPSSRGGITRACV